MKNTTKAIVESTGGSILDVKDLMGMAKWYGELLQIPVGEVNLDIPFYVFDMDNRINLRLDVHRNWKSTSTPICQFLTSDIEYSYNRIKSEGYRMITDIESPHPGLDYFTVEDSEKNNVMILQSDWVNPHPILPINKEHPIKNHINSMVIPVKDLKRATEWYSFLLGHSIKPDRQDGGPIYWFDMDNGTGLLLDDNRNNQHLNTFPTFMLKASNIHEAYHWVKNKGIKLLSEIQYDHYFYIEDPEGNTIMICA